MTQLPASLKVSSMTIVKGFSNLAHRLDSAGSQFSDAEAKP